MVLPEISREELQRKMARGDKFTLVETLPAMTYAAGHLPGAINLPPDRVTDLASGILPDKLAEIVLYCGSFT